MQPKSLNWESIKSILQQKQKVIIGRDSDCDIVINDPYISRKHLEISILDGTIFVEDLNSTNGTYLNDRRIHKKHKLQAGDGLAFGNTLLIVDAEGKDLNTYHPIEISGLSVVINNKTLLHPLSISVGKGEILAVMGPSGCGKSTLLKAIMNIIPVTQGKIKIFGLSLKENKQFLSNKIGYVPQQDIIHKLLKTQDALYYISQLRLGPYVSNQQKKDRITYALKNVGLDQTNIRNNYIKNLSGGQLKRISIASVLITQPEILLLDEPTSPLDPESVNEFMSYLHQLKQQQKAIVLVTHKPEDLRFCDKVLFLSSGGYPVYYGDTENLLTQFNVNNINEIYKKFSDAHQGKLYYEENYLSKDTNVTNTKSISYNKARRNLDGFIEQWYLSVWQWYWMSVRLLKLRWSSLPFIFIKFGQPILIGILIGLMFSHISIAVIFILVISIIWFGISSSAREIVDELSIFQFEKIFGLNTHSYLLSKLFVLMFFGIIEILLLLYTTQHFYKDQSIHLGNIFELSHLMLYVILASITCGLMISSFFRQSEKVMNLLPLTLIPQMLFTGVITPLDHPTKQFISYFTISRWGTEMFCHYQHHQHFTEGTKKILFNPKYDTTFKIIYPCEKLPCMGSSKIEMKIPEKIHRTYMSQERKKEGNIFAKYPVLIKDTLEVQNSDTLPMMSKIWKYEPTDVFSEINFYQYHSSLQAYTGNVSSNKYILILFSLLFYLMTFYNLIIKKHG